MRAESTTQRSHFDFVCSLRSADRLEGGGEMYSGGGDVYHGFWLLGGLVWCWALTASHTSNCSKVKHVNVVTNETHMTERRSR